ncbi:hypothetical protein ASG38_13085 [Flavobacterium sp. Leaf359]|uniref:Dyp-type peroxidase domain-containing protein n=1 Tax=Flavobacterium sp. Leaf359 TaxID=1736351 RepID=UPI0006F78C2B|nr:Dyp-type peroxidase domain-containing protein [Flavobacterium sp. Leaf359]KQS46101.1 hypothetical protein ASG38_13085 [Flavobacterium sp. Leaf359]
MHNTSQNVTDYPNDNTYFLVWNFIDQISIEKIKTGFQRICALVINLNHFALDRFPDSKASCVMGIGYEAWLRLNLQKPLPKELKPFEPIICNKHSAVPWSLDIEFVPRFSICLNTKNIPGTGIVKKNS